MTETQTWNADSYARNAGFVPEYGSTVLQWLAPQPGENIVDLGCGDGVLTEKIQRAGATVLGVDSSAHLLDAARARGLAVQQMDAQALDLPADYDAVFSNAALHWMLDPDAVLLGVRGCLRQRGRFVAEFGGHGNVAAVATALMAALSEQGIDGSTRWPWHFPTADEWRERLEKHGFTVSTIELVARPTPLPTGIDGWLKTFANPFLQDMNAEQAQQIRQRVAELLAISLCDSKGRWTADYMRLRFVAALQSA